MPAAQTNFLPPISEITPITVFTGFLGAGKTTIILKIIKQMPPNYNVVLLKNEYGDAETDSALAQESNLQVTEMTNGCLCCVLVGQMKNALIEIKEKFKPDRIIVETSGSAFPAPIAWQIRQMKEDKFELDSIMTVIDCENFMGYEDTSYTAKLQAQYTDLILLNKVDEISERQLDLVIDHVDELNTDTPKIRVHKTSEIPLDLVFGIDTQLYKSSDGNITFEEGKQPHGHTHDHNSGHHDKEIDVIQVHVSDQSPSFSGQKPNNLGDEASSPSAAIKGYYYADLKKFLEKLPSEDVYRVKGVVKLLDRKQDLLLHPELGSVIPVPSPDTNSSAITNSLETTTDSSVYILNFAYKRWTLTPITKPDLIASLSNCIIKIVIMGVSLRMYQKLVIDSLHLLPTQISATWAH